MAMVCVLYTLTWSSIVGSSAAGESFVMWIYCRVTASSVIVKWAEATTMLLVSRINPIYRSTLLSDALTVGQSHQTDLVAQNPDRCTYSLR